MRRSLLFLALLAVAPAHVHALDYRPGESWTLPGVACDATSHALGGLWSLRAAPGAPQRVSWLPAQGPLRSWPAPAGAVAADLCVDAAGHPEVLFLTDRGLVNAAGDVRLAGASPFAVPHRGCLWLTSLCGGPAGQELRLPLAEGLRVAMPGAPPATLPLPAPTRAYGAGPGEGLQSERPYAFAVSYFVPTQWDADADGDGSLDLWLVHEERVALFLRSPRGTLLPGPSLEASLLPRAGEGERTSVRVRVADHDGDGRAELLALFTEGSLPARSRATLWGLDDLQRGGPGQAVLDEEGFFQFTPRAPGPSPTRTWLMQTPTSRLALAAAWASGRSELVLWSLAPPRGAARAQVQRRRVLYIYGEGRFARRAGAWPVVAADLTGDGVADLLDGGEAGHWRIYAGEAGTFREQAAWQRKVPGYDPRRVLLHPRGFLLEKRARAEEAGGGEPPATEVVLWTRALAPEPPKAGTPGGR